MYRTSCDRQNNLQVACGLTDFRYTGNTDMGRQFLGSSFVPDLCRGVTFAFFHSAGITFRWIVKLKMTDNVEARASAPSLSRRDGIPSTPLAFFDFNSLRALQTSDTVIFRSLNFSGRLI